MELPNEEGDEMPMPLPLSSTYGGGHGHMIHHHDHHSPPPPSSHHHLIIPSSAPPQNGPPISSSSADDHAAVPVPVPFKKIIIRYRECLKNHAAAMGGNATDGCGEFMPSGDDGSLEALTCSACSCHRNFHRKEIDGADCDYHNNPRSIGRKLFVGHHHHHHKGPYLGGPESIGYHISSRPPPPPHQMIMSYNMGGGGGSMPSESDEQEGNMMVRAPLLVKKRFRTKFSQEQKEKMLNFAEKVGWKIQKQEEGVVQQFCQEIGVKRRVLKVWMHNNKHTLAKKQSSSLQSHDHPQPHQSDPHPQPHQSDPHPHQDQTLGTN